MQMPWIPEQVWLPAAVAAARASEPGHHAKDDKGDKGAKGAGKNMAVPAEATVSAAGPGHHAKGAGEHAKGTGKNAAAQAEEDARASVPGVRGIKYTRADIDGATNEKVTKGAAHTFLQRWRAIDQGEVERVLWDDREFDWVGYLKHHPDLECIVPPGVGVINFSIARSSTIDTNTKTARVDFVVSRDDGNFVRLHPSTKQEARPVIVPDGKKDSFLLGRDTDQHVFVHVATHKGKGQGKTMAPEATHFVGASTADILQPSAVRLWLADRAALWPGIRFTKDVTTQLEPLEPRRVPFPWHLFVPLSDELSDMQPIVAVWVVWTDRPALYFRSDTGAEAVVDLGVAGAKGLKLSRDVAQCQWGE